MTYGEFALLRVLREASSIAHLPIEILKEIIRQVNLSARVAYHRRLRLNEINLAQEEQSQIAGQLWAHKWPRLWADMRARVRRENFRRGPGF